MAVSAIESNGSNLMTVGEVARIFRVDDTTVRRWIKTHALEAITLPAHGHRQAYRIKRRTVEKFLGGPIPPQVQ